MADKIQDTPETVDQYISGFPVHARQRMEEIRLAIKGIAPGIQEKISWRMPTFFIGRNRVHFAGHKNHIGLYPGVRPIELFGDELKDYHTSKGGIQFPYDKPLPVDLIKRVAMTALFPAE